MNFDWLNDTTDSSFDSFTGDDLSLSPEFEFFPSSDTWCSFPDLPPTVEETVFLGDASPFLSSDYAFNSTEPMHVESFKAESLTPLLQSDPYGSVSQMEYNRVPSPPLNLLWIPLNPTCPNPRYQPQMSTPIFNPTPRMFSPVPYEKKVQVSAPSFLSTIPHMSKEKLVSPIALNPNRFVDSSLYPEPSFRAPSPRLFDVSRVLSSSRYTEIFQQHGSTLLRDKHPQWTESDLFEIEKTGCMYFLKNVKTIVPRIGPWKFQSHVRSLSSSIMSYDADRSYNLIGSKAMIRCKVREWIQGSDLWRMYHYVAATSKHPRGV